MSYRFEKDELIPDGEVDGERFSVIEEEGMVLVSDGPGDVYCLSLCCGDPESEKGWRDFHIEFEKLEDYQAFCELLRRAYLITM